MTNDRPLPRPLGEKLKLVPPPPLSQQGVRSVTSTLQHKLPSSLKIQNFLNRTPPTSDRARFALNASQYNPHPRLSLRLASCFLILLFHLFLTIATAATGDWPIVVGSVVRDAAFLVGVGHIVLRAAASSCDTRLPPVACVSVVRSGPVFGSVFTGWVCFGSNLFR